MTGGIVAGYFVFQPANANPFTGSFNPGVTTTGAKGVKF